MSDPKSTASTVHRLSPGAIQAAEHRRKIHHVEPSAGTPYDALKDPVYWSNVSRHFSPFDLIEVLPSDGSWWAQWIVVAAGNNWARCQEITRVKIDDNAADVTADTKYEVRHRGPVKRWSIVRKSDQAVIAENMAVRAEADAALAEHLKALG